MNFAHYTSHYLVEHALLKGGLAHNAVTGDVLARLGLEGVMLNLVPHVQVNMSATAWLGWVVG